MKNEKILTLRLPHDLWVFLRKKAFEKEMSLSKYLNKQLQKVREKEEKKDK